MIARAKIRFVVILSNDFECDRRQFKQVIVAPTYTLDPNTHPPEFLERVRNHRFPSQFYLPTETTFPDVTESYIDFRQVQALDKEFLQEGKLRFHLTRWAITAAIEHYRRYLALDKLN